MSVALAGGLEDPEIVSMLAPLLRTDVQAVENYVSTPVPPWRCSIVSMVGDWDDGHGGGGTRLVCDYYGRIPVCRVQRVFLP
jgi:hypothetical protein